MVFVLEIIGTIAFAVSGAIVGIGKKMDIFGVAILGMTTAVGGGIIRDIILGNTPPTAFVKPVYLIVGIAVSVVVFLPPIRSFFLDPGKVYEVLLQIMDSVGLGIFTVVGARTAYSSGQSVTIFLAVFVGVVTGVGGGVLRDIFSNEIPSIFVKYFYATASIIGAVCYCIIRNYVDESIAMISGGVIVVILRLLAAKFRWKLPRA